MELFISIVNLDMETLKGFKVFWQRGLKMKQVVLFYHQNKQKPHHAKFLFVQSIES